jgi:hypothetical protein
MAFKKAEKKQCKLRMAIFAPSGGGKTYTSLMLGKAFGKIAYIDTENGSSAKYIGDHGIPDYDIAELNYSGDAGAYVRELISLIQEAQVSYDLIVIDSLTHAWEATKDEVDAAAKRMRYPNSFAAWKEGSTLWGQLISAIVMCQTNIICCARSKMAYEQVEDKGKKKVQKVGMSPELRDGMEYEFDIVGEMDHEHSLAITKSRCHAVADRVFDRPNESIMEPILSWLSSGVPDLKAEKSALYARLSDEAREKAGEQCAGKELAEQVRIMQGLLE